MVPSLTALGAERGGFVGLAAAPDGTVGLSVGEHLVPIDAGGLHLVHEVDVALRPRWVCWSPETAAVLVAHGVRLATCWDVAAVHRLLFGGWRAETLSG